MLQTLRSLKDVQQHYCWLQDMRENHPVWLDETSGCWHVFRYRDVCRVLAEYEFFSSERRLPGRAHTSKTPCILLDLDPPQHPLYRNLVAPFFTPQALARLAGRIAAITQVLIDQVRSTGYMDVMSDVAYPLPATIITELLGVLTTDLPQFKKWSDEASSMLLHDEEYLRRGEDEQVGSSRLYWVDEMSTYFGQVLEEHQSAGRKDLINALIEARVQGERLKVEEIISFCFVLLRAGHITTTSLLSQAVRCFDEHPNTLEHLRTHPGDMPEAIEEVLRYASPVWTLPRTARTGVTIDGVTIPKGSRIFAWLASVNRDDEQFLNPEKFEITRSPNQHIAFGYGIHICVGAPLARLEASIVLSMLLEQLPNLHVCREEPLELAGGFGPFDFRHLPVTFTPSDPIGIVG